MLFGYALVLMSEGEAALDIQYRALRDAGVTEGHIYKDHGFERSGLDTCLQALRPGDTLVVWKLDRLGRGLRHLVGLVPELTRRGVGLKVLSGEGAAINTTGGNKDHVAGFFAALAEFEQSMAQAHEPNTKNSESARNQRGRKRKLTPVQLRAIQLAVGNPDTNITDLCSLYGISSVTLYRYVSPNGELRPHALKVMQQNDTDDAVAVAPGPDVPVVKVRTTDIFIQQYRFLIASLVILVFNSLVNGLLVVNHFRPAAVNLYLPGLFGVILISSMFLPRDRSLLARLSWALLIPEIGSLVSYTFLSMVFWHQLGYFGTPKGIEPWLMAATVTPLAIAKVWRISLLLISYCGIDYYLFPPLGSETQPATA